MLRLHFHAIADHPWMLLRLLQGARCTVTNIMHRSGAGEDTDKHNGGSAAHERRRIGLLAARGWFFENRRLTHWMYGFREHLCAALGLGTEVRL